MPRSPVASRRGEVAASVTRTLPLVGAWPRARSDEIVAPRPARAPLRRRGAVRRRRCRTARPPLAGSRRRSCAGACGWRVRSTSDDLLDRRTRLGLVDADRAASMRCRAGRARGLTRALSRPLDSVERMAVHRLEERPRRPRRRRRRRRERPRVPRDRHRRRRGVRPVPAGRDARLPRRRAERRAARRRARRARVPALRRRVRPGLARRRRSRSARSIPGSPT